MPNQNLSGAAAERTSSAYLERCNEARPTCARPRIGIDSGPSTRRGCCELWETAPAAQGLLRHGRSQGDRHPLHRHRLRLPGRWAASRRWSCGCSWPGPNLQLLTPEQYDQLFTMHGMTMIFLYAAPVLSGFTNYLWPLLLGSRDMAFPRLNALSYWIYLAGGIFLYAGFLIGQRPERRLVQLRAVRRARLQPRTQQGLLFARA